ncbi:hypothetical protein D9611_012938 [Ephemerocybe angulata]|uniref:Uncharacterized protein n=1 Tax=Ephemerocybe angulata TaxID=980116 RepID=A0A8H5C3U8_9AGAR|nr:hypothetical protein D9611_012938 [Tulosesus angulatus]
MGNTRSTARREAAASAPASSRPSVSVLARPSVDCAIIPFTLLQPGLAGNTADALDDLEHEEHDSNLPASLHGHLDFYDQRCEREVTALLPHFDEASTKGPVFECPRCILTAYFNLDARAEAERDAPLAILVGQLCTAQAMQAEYEAKIEELRGLVMRMEQNRKNLAGSLRMESGREEIAAEVMVVRALSGGSRMPRNLTAIFAQL